MDMEVHRLIHILFDLAILVLGKSVFINVKSSVSSQRPHSVQRGGRVEIIANDQGHRITPSWVGFTDEERLCVFLAFKLRFIC